MKGLRRWAVLLGIFVLLATVLLTGPGFTFPPREGQEPTGGDGSGDESDGWSPQDILEYIEDWLRGDDPAAEDGGEGEGDTPSQGEPESPGGTDVPPPGAAPSPPADPVPPAQENQPVTLPGGDQTGEEGVAPEPAPTVTEGQDQGGELGSISGVKFLDANLNGCRDAGEPGIAGVGIRLEDGCDTWCAITDGDGSYCFSGLRAETYEVEVIDDTVPAGHFHTTDPDEHVCLAAGGMHKTVDFGNGVRGEEETGSISGVKFLDANLNGCRDAGEPGIAGVGIRLEKGCDTWCAITDGDGFYCFSGLEADTYEVEVIEGTVPAGHFHTTERDELVCLKPACMDQVVDFGNGVRGEEETGSISGVKFLDANLNGCRDAGEPGIAGVGIRLEKGYDTWEQVTGADGSYSFQGLKADTYEVEVIEGTVPAGHFHTTERDELVCLKPACMDQVVDFGNGVHKQEDLGSISGRKWRDGDANGEFSFSDCPLAGVEIQLWRDGGLVATQTTSNAPCDKGSYCFDALEPGVYTVREAAPSGYYPTNPNSGEWSIELRPGERRCSVNFLNARSLSISGTKWEWRDENGDGVIQDAERYPLEGVTIQLCSPCSPEPVEAVTAADGTYAFTAIRPGIYSVKEVLLPGWHAADPASGCRVVELVCDYDQTDIDFVNARDPSISGTKWEWVDANGNSVVDGEELQPLPGVEIRLLRDGQEVLPSAHSDKNGAYSFTGLKPGTYTVSEVLTQGWYAVTPNGGTMQVDVKAGIDASGTDFINSQVEVAGEVVTPVTPVAGAQAQATGELPQTGMNQTPYILASFILVLMGLFILALGLFRSFNS